MGVLTITNMCAHLQNASRARLGLTSVPNNKYNLRLALALHRAGLISSVTRGGYEPPPPEDLLSFETEPVTTANVATRRLWLGLKYWEQKPVMSNVTSISKPKRSISIGVGGLERVIRGFRYQTVQGLTLGETLFLSTPGGILEAREAVAQKQGGLVLCLVS